MALTPYPIDRFGGLTVGVDPFEVGATGATALSNVDLDIGGQIRTRPGREYVDSDDSATFSDNILRVISNLTQGGVTRHLAVSATKVAVYENNQVYTAAITADVAGRADLMTDSTALDWVQDATGLRQWDSGAHTLSAAVVGVPKGGFLGYAPRSSRIVIAAANAAGLNLDRVNFLDAGAATFTSTNWVDLEPGREYITGTVTLGDDVWVFKHTRAYIFTSESTDADGQPIFNYRTLNLGDRIRPYGEGVGPPGRFASDGNYVYWVAARGVYRSAGGPPELISGPITPVFRGEVSGMTGFATANTYVMATDDRLYVGSSDATVTLVLEKATGQWMVYGFAAYAMAASKEPRSAYVATSRRLTSLSPLVTTDLGSAIAWSYASGRYPLSDPGRVACTQESSVVGSGTVAMSVTTDLYGALAGPGATLGTAPATAEGWPMGDQEGTWFQHTLSGSGAAVVNRLTHHVSFVKPGGLR